MDAAPASPATVVAAAASPAPGLPQLFVVDPRALIAAGDFDGASTLLRNRLAANPRDVEAHFLLGMIAVRRKAYTAAAREFRQALAIAPNEVRIRLELARVLFLQGNYRAALRHFQLAETAKLPPEVRKNVDRYLAAIRRAKKWSYSFDLALAPDSNINTATSARDAIIFGLPFTLDPRARRTSGVGLAFSGSLEFAPRLARNLRWRMGADASLKDYRATSFDDHSFGLYSGPRVQLGAFDISALGTAAVRDYGGKLYERAFGGRLETAWYVSPRSAATLAVIGESQTFPSVPAQDGVFLALDAGYIRALSPVSSASGDVGLTRQSASAPTLSNKGLLAGLGYRRELGGGFGVEVRPVISYLRYDAADPVFGMRRTDMTGEISVSLTDQRFTIWQFTPRVTYRFSRRSSNISLYSFTQNRLEVGLTTDF